MGGDGQEHFYAPVLFFEQKAVIYIAMNNALKTLFLPVHKGSILLEGKKILFLNAVHDPLLENGDWDCRQVFKPYAIDLEKNGISTSSDLTFEKNNYDLALILIPKNVTEARFLVASALFALKQNGQIICAADNKAGGTRLKKLFENFGLHDPANLSKHKCRVVWADINGFDEDQCTKALQAGQPQSILNGQFISQPGIYGWDKEDLGSRLLCKALPDDIKGYGTDFGCGYGYLAHHVLEKSPKIKHIECHDADYRAVKCCEANIKDKASFHWTDLSKPFKPKKLLDFVIMNPPFHEGKKTDISLGQAFIKNAAASLRRKGSLWMVANAHLPYEEILNKEFFHVEKIAERQGFKIYRADK